MLDRSALLSDLQKLLAKLEADLLERSASADVPEVGKTLRAEFERAQQAERTAQNYEDWRSDAITQHAAAWVLSAVFVRFLEDNSLIEPPRIAGPGERLQRARDEHELYFRQHPKETDRDYLLHTFDELAGLPGTRDVFGGHNPLRELPNWLSGDAAGELLRFFQKIDANTGLLVHDFTSCQSSVVSCQSEKESSQSSVFSDQSEQRRSRSSSGSSGTDNRQLTTDNSLFRMIDPACGSGHFLLGAFRRILDRWQRLEPGTNVRVLVQRTLDSIHGVDVNPYAIAIARFRLLLAALRACGITRLADAPAFRLNLVCGDSLLHGVGEQQSFGWADVDHAAYAEDLAELRCILVPGQYHAVVANPPYITVKDKALNQAYRDRYRTCHMKYSLSAPFLERIFRLASPGGYTGQITSNSFMKREFGKKLIEELLPTVDLTHVIDTSGAYIPGHGTPTVILFGRHCKPVAGTIRTVLGIRGEPATPDDPARGLVWSAIVAQIDQPGSQSEFVSVGDSSRDLFGKHPWSIGGGGAAELKELIESTCEQSLRRLSPDLGYFGIAADDAMVCSHACFRRRHFEGSLIRRFITGDHIRDWLIDSSDFVFLPYLNDRIVQLDEYPRALSGLWPYRTSLGNRPTFGRKTYFEEGKPWWDWHQVTMHRLAFPYFLTYSSVATHNQFALRADNSVLNRHAPLILLPEGVGTDDYLALQGLLNSSAAGFWLKQVGHNKGSTVDQNGARQTTVPFEDFWEYTSTKLTEFPLPADRPLRLSRQMDHLAQHLSELSPSALFHRWETRGIMAGPTVRAAFENCHEQWEQTRREMIAAQEELDWECYRLYGLLDEDLTLPEPPPLQLGQRAFEIVLARKMAAGETQTTWFARHGSTPITKLPADWPADYRRLVERRIELIETDPNIRLIEQPEYKRRWNTEPWESQLERALREWLLDRLESYFDFDGRMKESCQSSVVSRQSEKESGQSSVVSSQSEKARKSESGSSSSSFTENCQLTTDNSSCRFPEPALVSLAKLADIARNDPQFQEVGALYRDDPAFDVQRLVEELVAAESVPLLPVLRYKDSGLRKRLEWERTWELQREEDRRQSGKASGQSSVVSSQSEKRKTESSGSAALSSTDNRQLTTDNFPPIPVPPKYTSADFLKSDFWRLRGKLDVPKERWVSFPHCDGADGTAMIAWAGYDHLQLALAIAEYYEKVRTELGGRDDPRLPPLLAGLAELVPWLKQWHNEPDAAFGGQAMGDYFEGFVQEEARELGLTVAGVKGWTPPAKVAKGRKKKTS